jgi:hypothetical protein
MEKEYNFENKSPIHLPPKGRSLLGQEIKKNKEQLLHYSNIQPLWNKLNSIKGRWLK